MQVEIRITRTYFPLGIYSVIPVFVATKISRHTIPLRSFLRTRNYWAGSHFRVTYSISAYFLSGPDATFRFPAVTSTIFALLSLSSPSWLFSLPFVVAAPHMS